MSPVHRLSWLLGSVLLVGCGLGSVGSPATATISFAASPSVVPAGGSATLTWTVSDATSIHIDPAVGAVDASGSVAVSPDATTTYTLTAQNAAGTATATATVTVLVPPRVIFSASPGTVAPGSSSTITWEVTGASSVSIDQGVGTVAAAGSLSVTPSATTTYTLTASNDAGTSTATALVTVVGAAAKPVVTFTATPTAITQGATSTLAWSVSGATSVDIDQGVGLVATTGSLSVTPAATTTYTLTATNAAGSASATVTVTVGSTPAKPTVTFTATPGTIASGGTSTLAWTVAGATTVSISGGIGTVSASGSRVVSPNATTTYTLTATNSAGTTTSSATVTVGSLPTVTFSASPAAVSAGTASTLSWTVTGATSISIDQGVGAVAASGQQQVTPSSTTTYTLTATNAVGQTTKVATVTVSSTPPATPTGWLYTKAGSNKIYVQSGGAETVWVGRGVNIDDLFLCGYNSGLWMSGPTGGEALLQIGQNLVSQWRPTLIRVSLAMATNSPTVSWLASPAQYHDPMVAVINALGSNPGVYVLVTVRSDATMNCSNGEATCLPTTATDPLYQALVTDFKDAPYVLFGVSNEPGGNAFTNAQIAAAMSHAVSVIRAKEDALGTPHHIVVVQGNVWTSSIGFYSTTPLTQDNVAYEYHAYPPSASAYTFSNIPVIIGEYGNNGATMSPSLFTDLEAKQISSTAWDFEPYSSCPPDLLNTNRSSSTFSPTSYGQQVKDYLTAH